jgi:hypothetical protein
MQSAIDPPKADCRIYVRPEGNHFVGLCAELREIITGNSVDEIVARATSLSGSAEVHVAVHMRDPRGVGRVA